MGADDGAAGEEAVPGDTEALETMCAMLQERPHLAASLAQWMIPDLCPAPARAITDGRYTGQIVKHSVEKGFGFISCPEVKETFGCDVWVHFAQLGQFKLGDTVSFAVLLNKDLKPQAFDCSAPEAGKGQSANSVGKGTGVVVPAPAQSKGTGALIVSRTPAPVWEGSIQASPGTKRTWDIAMTAGQDRYTGSIIDFKPEKGYGFISCPAVHQLHGRDTWLHRAQFEGFTVGDNVTFTLVTNAQGHPQAIDLAPIASKVAKVVRPPPRNQGAVVVPSASGKGTEFSGKDKGKHGPNAGKGGDEQRYGGTIKSFMPDRGYGFIDCDEIQGMYGKEVWLHHKQLKDFSVGDQVTFSLILNASGQPQGIDLEALEC